MRPHHRAELGYPYCMVASNIAVTHADTGLVLADVVRAEQISPHFVRVTLAGEELAQWRDLGFDQWFRLAVPTSDDARFDNLSDRFNMSGYLRYLTLPKATRPVIRNYTVREYRSAPAELDIDFVVHGEAGVAGPWAAGLPVGDTVGLIDQGCGFRNIPAERTILVGDESALPAVIGILRDLDRGTTGTAIIEVPDAADEQAVEAPIGMDVQWVVRRASDRVGTRALAALEALGSIPAEAYAFAAGESKLATGARRHLVGLGVPKDRITFCGYWKAQHQA